MNFRRSNVNEHEIICKQIRSQSVLYVCIMAPVIPLTLLAVFLSGRMMLRDNYDMVVFAVSMVFLILMLLAVAYFMIVLMKGFLERISYICKHEYMVADCIVVGRDERINPKHIHCYVTVGFSDGNTIRAEVPAKVYCLAEDGKQSLLVRYDEPEGKKKRLPYEVAVL